MAFADRLPAIEEMLRCIPLGERRMIHGHVIERIAEDLFAVGGLNASGTCNATARLILGVGDA